MEYIGHANAFAHLYAVVVFNGSEPKKSILKLPKELELPQMKDHQMFKRERIVVLQEELQDRFKELKVGRIKIATASYVPCTLCRVHPYVYTRVLPVPDEFCEICTKSYPTRPIKTFIPLPDSCVGFITHVIPYRM